MINIYFQFISLWCFRQHPRFTCPLYRHLWELLGFLLKLLFLNCLKAFYRCYIPRRVQTRVILIQLFFLIEQFMLMFFIDPCIHLPFPGWVLGPSNQSYPWDVLFIYLYFSLNYLILFNIRFSFHSQEKHVLKFLMRYLKSHYPWIWFHIYIDRAIPYRHHHLPGGDCCIMVFSIITYV